MLQNRKSVARWIPLASLLMLVGGGCAGFSFPMPGSGGNQGTSPEEMRGPCQADTDCLPGQVCQAGLCAEPAALAVCPEGATMAIYYADQDGDGSGSPAASTQACSQPRGYVADGGDCDDTKPEIHPVADEACDGVDNNCDGRLDEGVSNACGGCSSLAHPPGEPCDGPDADLCAEGAWGCNRDKNNVSCTDRTEDTPEICDGADNDCDGQTDEDFAGVGQACDGPDGDLCKNGVLFCRVDGSALDCGIENPADLSLIHI